MKSREDWQVKQAKEAIQLFILLCVFFTNVSYSRPFVRNFQRMLFRSMAIGMSRRRGVFYAKSWYDDSPEPS
jgi:hypothetical protein